MFSKRFDYTERLLYINSDESLDAFFEAFQSEITYWKESLYYEKEYLNNWSLLSNMLWVLYKFHPIKLFRDRDSYLEKGLPLGEEETFEYLEPYYILVEKAIKDLYGREIKIKAPYLSRSKFQ